MGALCKFSSLFREHLRILFGRGQRDPRVPQQTQDGGRRPAAVLPAMERLPDQHGLLVQAPPRREVLHRRHPRLRRTDLQAHKMVLSACSPYFKALLEENPAKHPIIILKDVPFQHLTAILEFMYAGEVNVAQDQLPAFLKTAERLKVKGLAEAPQTIKQE